MRYNMATETRNGRINSYIVAAVDNVENRGRGSSTLQSPREHEMHVGWMFDLTLPGQTILLKKFGKLS
jgi:hypothetical protein